MQKKQWYLLVNVKRLIVIFQLGAFQKVPQIFLKGFLSQMFQFPMSNLFANQTVLAL